MAVLTETSGLRITVTEDGLLESTTITRVFRDGKEFSYHSQRNGVIEPGADVSDREEKIRTIAAAAHTPEVVAAWAIERARRFPVPPE